MWPAEGMGLFCLVLLVASLVLLVLDLPAIDSSTLVGLLPAFLAIGIVTPLAVMIAVRRPHNSVGWLLLATISAGAVGVLAGFVAIRGQLAGASPNSWVAWPAWVNYQPGQDAPLLILFAILLFPDGKLPGRRWRWVLWCFVPVTVFGAIATAVTTGSTQLSSRLPTIPFPRGLQVLTPVSGGRLTPGVVAYLAVLTVFFVLVATSVVVRLRRASGIERPNSNGSRTSLWQPLSSLGWDSSLPARYP